MTEQIGLIVGILSGDSFLVKFNEENNIYYEILHLTFSKAPQFSVFDSNIIDEPGGYESWIALRELLLDEQIIIYKKFSYDLNPTLLSTLYNIKEYFGIFRLLKDKDIDIDGFLLINGNGQLSKLSENLSESDYLIYQDKQHHSKENLKGIWSRTLEIKEKDKKPEQFLSNQFDINGIIISFDPITFFFIILTENGYKFTLELIGIVHNNLQYCSNEILKLSINFFFDHLFTRSSNIRIFK